ncbi:MAG: ribosome recycling factor [bacterium]|jgi:ribosome recycling factor|nr:ribosome recycling factor [bacterium]
MTNEFLEESQMEMDETVEGLRKELSQLRTGRATPALLDGIFVEAYGAKSPIKQVANISIPEARLIVIQPWDKSVIGEIEKAILKSELGITPNNDGKLIRLNIPPLTEQRRKDLVKLAKKLGEECKIKVRQIRRECNDSLKKSQKEGEIPEDECKNLVEEVQKLTDKTTDAIDTIIKDKETEIMNF